MKISNEKILAFGMALGYDGKREWYVGKPWFWFPRTERVYTKFSHTEITEQQLKLLAFGWLEKNQYKEITEPYRDDRYDEFEGKSVNEKLDHFSLESIIDLAIKMSGVKT